MRSCRARSSSRLKAWFKGRAEPRRLRRAVLALVTPSTWIARNTSLLSSGLREDTSTQTGKERESLYQLRIKSFLHLNRSNNHHRYKTFIKVQLWVLFLFCKNIKRFWSSANFKHHLLLVPGVGVGAVLVPAALHLLQAQQMNSQQTRHPLAASLWIRAHVQSEGTHITCSFLGNCSGRCLLPWQQLRGVSVTKITWMKKNPQIVQNLVHCTNGFGCRRAGSCFTQGLGHVCVLAYTHKKKVC